MNLGNHFQWLLTSQRGNRKLCDSYWKFTISPVMYFWSKKIQSFIRLSFKSNYQFIVSRRDREMYKKMTQEFIHQNQNMRNSVGQPIWFLWQMNCQEKKEGEAIDEKRLNINVRQKQCMNLLVWNLIWIQLGKSVCWLTGYLIILKKYPWF